MLVYQRVSVTYLWNDIKLEPGNENMHFGMGNSWRETGHFKQKKSPQFQDPKGHVYPPK
jgi:hypothetical protein